MEEFRELATPEETRPSERETRELIIKTLRDILPTDEFRELIQETLRPSIEYRLLRDEFTLLSARLEASFEGFRREISALASEMKADYRTLREEILSSTKEAIEGIKETMLSLQRGGEEIKVEFSQISKRIEEEIVEALNRIDIRPPIAEMKRDLESLRNEIRTSIEEEVKKMQSIIGNALSALKDLEVKIENKVEEKLSYMDNTLKRAIDNQEQLSSKIKSNLETQKLDIQTLLGENAEKIIERINNFDSRVSSLESRLSGVSSKTTLNLLLLLATCGGLAFIISKLMGG